jgi:hypothetical protein
MRSVVPTQLPDQWRQGTGEADNLFQPITEVKNAWGCTATSPHTPASRGAIVQEHLPSRHCSLPRDRLAKSFSVFYSVPAGNTGVGCPWVYLGLFHNCFHSDILQATLISSH